jgi:hypothetical protein
MAEKLSDFKIKSLRTDDDLSYKGIFFEYLQANGIVKQTGQRYRKHVPARAERAHKTISNLGKAMLISSNLPSSFYSDAERCATYVFNRMVHSREVISPYEKLFGKKPNLKKMFPFGCVCYAHVPLECR